MVNEFDTNEVRKLTLEADVQEKGACERHITIKVSRADVDFYLDREYSELQEKQAIPGFRAGKAPRKMIEKRFKKEVVERVKSALVFDSLAQVTEDEKITAISEPKFKPEALLLPETGDFTWEFDVEVRPTFDIPNWKGLKLDKLTREFTDADVDEAVTRLQQSYGTLETKTEPAKVGDYIVTKLTFSLDGKEINSSESETIRVSSKLSFHDGVINDFDKLVEGVKAGDVRTTKLTVSNDATDEKLRGKEIEAKFEITEVKELILPELNDEFLHSLGGFENMGDFRDVVLDELKRQLEYEQQRRARRQITEQLTVGADWELPPELLKSQRDREFQRALFELRRSGFTDQQILSQFNVIRRNSDATTAQALKEHFILEAIAESENIVDEQRDYDLEIALMAAQSGESQRRIRSRIEKSGNMDVLRNQIIERKVIKKIMDAAEFTEVPYSPLKQEEEALDRPVSNENEIPEVTEEDAKAANREANNPQA